MKNALLTPELLKQAVDMVVPSIVNIAAAGITDKLAGTFTVLDPTGGDIIFTYDLSDHANASKYREISAEKAEVSYRTGLPSREVQQCYPHLYEDGDTKWGGSVFRDGLVVGFSGVQAIFDEMIAGWLADAIIALCRIKMAEIMKKDGNHVA